MSYLRFIFLKLKISGKKKKKLQSKSKKCYKISGYTNFRYPKKKYIYIMKLNKISQSSKKMALPELHACSLSKMVIISSYIL